MVHYGMQGRAEKRIGEEGSPRPTEQAKRLLQSNNSKKKYLSLLQKKKNEKK
jgi:hypothetical protein